MDPETGKVTTKLVLEDKKKPPSKLSHAVRDTPANAALGKVHKEIRETEQDNVGVESAHKSEEAAETGARLVREGYRSHKLKPVFERNVLDAVLVFEEGGQTPAAFAVAVSYTHLPKIRY